MSLRSRTSRIPRALGLMTLGAGAIGAGVLMITPGREAPVAPDGVPAPTEIARIAEERRDHREARDAWYESLHLAAPGVDWREIEAENRARLRVERAAHDRSDRVGAGAWTEIGSRNQAGRTHAAAVSPASGALYVGTSLGGVWRGTIDGTDWTPLSDGLGLGSHGLVVSSGSPEVITSVTDGGTVHASVNDGVSWFVPSGLPNRINECRRVIADAAVPGRVYLLVRGNDYVDDVLTYGNFVLRSDDGGQSYTRMHIEGYWPICDVWIDRVAGGDLYLMAGSTMSVSTDGAASFSTVGTAALTTDRVILTGSEAGAPTFYAAFLNGSQWELWRSTDGGTSWAYGYDIHDWWETLAASITNPNLVLFAGVECWRSTNGGGSFAKVNNWWDYYGDPVTKLHADFPGMDCVMVDGQETFFLNTDGGTFKSIDGVASVTNLSLDGLGISQYYSVFTSDSNPYLIVAGAQDQGYQQSVPGAAPFLDFAQLISGDYGHLTSTVRDHNLLFSVYPGFVLVQNRETAPQGLIQVDFPAGASYSWMPNIEADPTDPEVFYFCADHLWRYEHVSGATWSQTQLPQDFTVAGGAFLTALGISPGNPAYRYAITNSGKPWYSHDGGASWTASADGGPGAHYFYGTDILVSPTDPLIAYAGGSGYSGPAVYRTIDGGVTWQAMGDGLPSTLVFGLAFDDDVDQTLFAATEAGPYAYLSGAGQWVSILGTAPLTTYWCVEGVPAIDVVRFGTYGRGIWDFDALSPVAVADAVDPFAGLAVSVTPNPASSAAGIGFSLDREASIDVEVYDVTGRRLATPFTGVRPAGDHTIRFDLVTSAGRPLETGVYVVRVATGRAQRTAKLRVIR